MENTLYYTLSTLPQVLAAVLGLTAVFVTIRFGSFKKEILGYGQRIINRWEEIQLKQDKSNNLIYERAFDNMKGKQRLNRMRGAINIENWNFLIEQIEEIEKLENDLFKKAEIEKSTTGFSAQVAKMKKLKKTNEDFFKDFWIFVVISILSISLSVVCLMFVHYITCNCSYAYYVLGFNILFFLFALIFAGKLVFDSMRNLIKT